MDILEEYEVRKEDERKKFRKLIQARYKDRYENLSQTFEDSLSNNILSFLETCLLTFDIYTKPFTIISIDAAQLSNVRTALGKDMRPYIQLAVELEYFKQVKTKYKLTSRAKKLVKAYTAEIKKLDQEAAEVVINSSVERKVKKIDDRDLSISKSRKKVSSFPQFRSKKKISIAKVTSFIKKFIDEESIVSRYRIFNHLILHYKADKHDFGTWDGRVSTTVCKLVDHQDYVRTMVGSHAFISKPDFKIPKNPGLDWWNLDLYYMLYTIVSTFGRGSKTHTRDLVTNSLDYLKNILLVWSFSKPSGRFTDTIFEKHISDYKVCIDFEKKHFVFTNGIRHKLHDRIVRYFRENYNP